MSQKKTDVKDMEINIYIYIYYRKCFLLSINQYQGTANDDGIALTYIYRKEELKFLFFSIILKVISLRGTRANFSRLIVN